MCAGTKRPQIPLGPRRTYFSASNKSKGTEGCQGLKVIIEHVLKKCNLWIFNMGIKALNGAVCSSAKLAVMRMSDGACAQN